MGIVEAIVEQIKNEDAGDMLMLGGVFLIFVAVSCFISSVALRFLFTGVL